MYMKFIRKAKCIDYKFKRHCNVPHTSHCAVRNHRSSGRTPASTRNFIQRKQFVLHSLVNVFLTASPSLSKQHKISSMLFTYACISLAITFFSNHGNTWGCNTGSFTVIRNVRGPDGKYHLVECPVSREK